MIIQLRPPGCAVTYRSTPRVAPGAHRAPRRGSPPERSRAAPHTSVRPARRRGRRVRPTRASSAPAASGHAAVRNAVCAPIDWPTSMTGSRQSSSSSTATTSATNASRLMSAGSRLLAPCPRWSTATVVNFEPSAALVRSHSPECPASPCRKTTVREPQPWTPAT